MEIVKIEPFCAEIYALPFTVFEVHDIVHDVYFKSRKISG